MKIATMTREAIEVFGEEQGIALLADAGFDALDYTFQRYSFTEGIFAESDDAIFTHFAQLRKLIESRGIYVCQTHTPYPTYHSSPEKDAPIFEIQRKSLLASSALGSPYAVVHPAKLYRNIGNACSEENKSLCVDRYSKMIPYAEKYGIKIAIENMFTTDRTTKIIRPAACSSSTELADYVDTMNSLCKNGDRFVACLDVGHARLVGEKSIGDMIRTLGERIKVVHIHDNDGVKDRHTAPGFGVVDWDDVMLALREIGYDGVFSLETCGFVKHFDQPLMRDAHAMLCKIGRNLCERYSL